MRCGEGGSPFVETSNINSPRESSVQDKNQFLKVWSFPLAETTSYSAEKWPVTKYVHMQRTKQNLLLVKNALNLAYAETFHWNQAKMSCEVLK